MNCFLRCDTTLPLFTLVKFSAYSCQKGVLKGGRPIVFEIYLHRPIQSIYPYATRLFFIFYKNLPVVIDMHNIYQTLSRQINRVNHSRMFGVGITSLPERVCVRHCIRTAITQGPCKSVTACDKIPRMTQVSVFLSLTR